MLDFERGYETNVPYTRLADPRLELRIENDLGFVVDQIRREVPACRLGAIVLGGGYGRGDGGVRSTADGPRPFNDYDLFVVLRRRSPFAKSRTRRAIEKLRPDLERVVELPVELSVITVAELRRSPTTLMLFDLLHGNRVLWGELSLREEMPESWQAELPLIEGARLLVNRGSLLAHCKSAMFGGRPRDAAERERLVKYLNKAIVACGDAVLIARGRYVTNSDQRIASLREVALPPGSAVDPLRGWYEHAIQSRRNGSEQTPPDCSGLEDFFHRVWELFELVHRWFECRRLQTGELRWPEYVRAARRKFPAASLLHRVFEWRSAIRNRPGCSEMFARISRGREDYLADWLAKLLYLTGRPAVEYKTSIAEPDWVRSFQAYWSTWSEA